MTKVGVGHKVRKATKAEARHDCCGDRYPCNVAYVCSCGEQGCSECIKEHLLEHNIELIGRSKHD